jgi:molybdate/tungstate transport system substrate-binding protein
VPPKMIRCVADALRLCYLGDMFISPCSRSARFPVARRFAAIGTMLSLGASAIVAVTAAPSEAAGTHSGPVDVLSAGSLQDLMQDQVGPAFQKATGYTLDNVSMGSTALASSISGGTLQGDVFISASPAVNASLEGSSNGNWVSWYDQFASSPLVLGYNPSSKFAQALKTKPWYQVVSESGFHIGRTDPTTDPKGVLADTALNQAAKKHSLPALKTLGTETNDVFPETSLVGELQAGQLDAGFFYGVEAAAANIKTVPLTGTSLAGDYTITILNKAPHGAAAVAFVNFLLGKAGQKILAKNGVVATAPKVSGLQFAPIGVEAALK